MAKFHLPTLEEEQLVRWDEANVLRRIMDREDNPAGPFVFYEGPPTANGKPGIHHILNRAFKDAILRFRTMRGHRIDRKAGWDTHGLPVELAVEKQLGFTRKQEIEEYGIAEFNAKCKASVWEYKDLWEKITTRIGYWIDLDDPYVTYENGYVESLWSIIKEIDASGKLYEGHRVTPHCPRCVTSLSSHELAQGYKDVDDESVFIRFRVKGEKDLSFLVWTTTPWTLPANLALAVGPDIEYVEMKNAETGERIIMASALVGALEGEHETVKKMKGAELVGMEYEPLYDRAPAESRAAAYRVYGAGFVSTTDGTGIVHIAPAYGEDDAVVGREHGLAPLLSADATGIMADGVPGAGKKFKDADADIVADLGTRGLLYKKQTYRHSYPFCWRCDSPIMYLAKGSWYIAMSSLRDKLLASNEGVNWVPSHIRDGRFGEWLKDVKDWAFSRERYWGTPLPVWKCDSCDAKHTLGSLAELDTIGRPRNTYWFQRHGEANTNFKGIVSGYSENDPHALTDKGRAQLEERAAEYKAEGIDMIIASPVRRTKESAEIIAEATGIEVLFDERLREIDFGACDGKTIDEYLDTTGRGMARFTNAPEGGENIAQVRARVVALVKELEAKYEGKRIVLVTHGDCIWLALAAFMGVKDEDIFGDDVHYNPVGGRKELDLPRRPYDRDGKVDVHRPYIDEITLPCRIGGCVGTKTRVPDVIDVWFDSGAMPFAQWGYPNDGTRVSGGAPTNYPADYICEAIDQTRGWFYTLLAVATLLGKEAPYKNVICTGHILDGKGKKMSKSKGNVIDPWETIEKYGADAIRYWLFTVNQPGEPKRFDERVLSDITKKTFLILWNVLSFYEMFAEEKTDASVRPAPSHELDRWVLSELDALNARVTEGLTRYDAVGPARDIAEFITDLSTWYVRRSRDRFKHADAKVRGEAIATLAHVLHTLSRIMAPFTPFLADALYRATGGTLDSVHLGEWPKAGKADESLRTVMKTVREACSAGLERRAAAGIPVRQALASASVVAPMDGEEWMCEIVKDELNVLEVQWEKGTELAVTLDENITPELRRMGAARELVRHVNSMRKELKLTPQDRISVTYRTDGSLWKETLEAHKDGIMADVRATGFSEGNSGADLEKELELDDQVIAVGISKA
jgi:isoleucyl-tRNA synthetase